MIFKTVGINPVSPTLVISLRCPSCRQQGTFTNINNINDLSISIKLKANDTGFTAIYLGQRHCPNPDCLGHVFFVAKGDGKVIISYPAERIDFDSTGIPSNVVGALDEAIACHAISCFTASAIMVRKTLEELCADRGATGSNLKERLMSLGGKIVLPAELISGLDDLRLLGNDAAHIESQYYRQVGQEEVEVGIIFTKEVLKAVYQYSKLLSRLKALKKTT